MVPVTVVPYSHISNSDVSILYKGQILLITLVAVMTVGDLTDDRTFAVCRSRMFLMSQMDLEA